MKRLLIASVVSFLVLSFAAAHADWDPRQKEKETAAAKKTINQMLKQDPSLKALFDNAYGYAVFPKVGKGAYIIGFGYGKGWLYENGMAVGRASITQLSAGAQIGGQTYSEIVFFSDKQSANDFKAGKLELGAQVSAVAIKAGVGKAATYTNGVAVFILPKGGFMAEASVSGQRFAFTPF